ncbi:hypothetical protein HDK77DRAFT_283334 [Phyllosticta capitalensis]
MTPRYGRLGLDSYEHSTYQALMSAENNMGQTNQCFFFKLDLSTPGCHSHIRTLGAQAAEPRPSHAREGGRAVRNRICKIPHVGTKDSHSNAKISANTTSTVSSSRRVLPLAPDWSRLDVYGPRLFVPNGYVNHGWFHHTPLRTSSRIRSAARGRSLDINVVPRYLCYLCSISPTWLRVFSLFSLRAGQLGVLPTQHLFGCSVNRCLFMAGRDHLVPVT